MRVKQQKSQQQLAFARSGKVKPEARPGEGSETLTPGSRAESQARRPSLPNRPVRTLCRVVWEGGAARLPPIPIVCNAHGNQAPDSKLFDCGFKIAN